MATRLATTRNFITVTPVSNEESGASSSISASNGNTGSSDGQRTTQLTPVALHHLSQVSSVILSSNLFSDMVSLSEENHPSKCGFGKRQCHRCDAFGVIRLE